MTEKKPKQLWPQTPLQWLGVLVLVFLASSVMGAIFNQFNDPFPESTAATEKTQRALEELRRVMDEGDKPQEITTASESQIDPSQLIVGKWRRWGDSQFEGKSKFGATVEYFEDGTYVYRTDGNPPIINPKTTTGRYVVLSDGRLKTTHESCLSLPCKDIVSANPVSFPDPNTLWQHYEFGGKAGYNIYHRSPSP